MRVVLVSQYFPPEVGATQSRMKAFASYLAERGHDVTVICEFPNHPHGVLPSAYRGRLFEDDRSNPYRVIRVWVKTSRDKTQTTRMAFYLSFMTMATLAAPLAGRADVVVATSPPLFVGAAGLAVARMNQAPLVLDIRDLWPAAAISLDQISAGAVLRAAERLERYLYRAASVVTAVTRPFCAHIDRIRGKSPGTVLIPNGTTDDFFVDSNRAGRSRLGLSKDRFVVTFAGTHGIAQALPSVLDAAERVNGSIDFVFVGDGPVKSATVESARRRGLDNVVFHPQLPVHEVPEILAASDALLVPLCAHPTFESFVPSKMFDFMAVGRPVILSAAGEACRILERAGGGIVVPPEDPDSLAAAVQWLSEHPDQAAEQGRRGREFARTRTRREQARRLEEVLLEVTGRRG